MVEWWRKRRGEPARTAPEDRPPEDAPPGDIPPEDAPPPPDGGGPRVLIEVVDREILVSARRPEGRHDWPEARVPVRVRVVGERRSTDPGLTELLLVDCSRSMRFSRRFTEVKGAVSRAVELLPDGARFAVIRGSHTAEQIYPKQPSPGTAVASDATRREARAAVALLRADGGTAISSWLDAALDALRNSERSPVQHALLVTDGRNEHDTEERIAAALDAADGELLCDAWGIGEHYDAEVPLRIAHRLHGRADTATRFDTLTDAYAGRIAELADIGVPELILRITPTGALRAGVERVHQLLPSFQEIPGAGTAGPTEVHALAWHLGEIREYEAVIRLAPPPDGSFAGPWELDDPIHVADVSTAPAAPGDETCAAEPVAVAVRWTDAPQDEIPVHGLLLAGGQHRALAEASHEAYRAMTAEPPELDRALEKYAEAWRIATELQDKGQLDALRRVLELDGDGLPRLVDGADRDRGWAAVQDQLLTAQQYITAVEDEDEDEDEDQDEDDGQDGRKDESEDGRRGEEAAGDDAPEDETPGPQPGRHDG